MKQNGRGICMLFCYVTSLMAVRDLEPGWLGLIVGVLLGATALYLMVKNVNEENKNAEEDLRNEMKRMRESTRQWFK